MRLDMQPKPRLAASSTGNNNALDFNIKSLSLDGRGHMQSWSYVIAMAAPVQYKCKPARQHTHLTM